MLQTGGGTLHIAIPLWCDRAITYAMRHPNEPVDLVDSLCKLVHAWPFMPARTLVFIHMQALRAQRLYDELISEAKAEAAAPRDGRSASTRRARRKRTRRAGRR